MEPKKLFLFLLLGVFMINLASAALVDDTNTYWRLDNTTGVVYDMKGANDGTNNGATRGATGKLNDAFGFDGISDTVTADDTFTMASDWSINIWFEVDDTTGNKEVISQGSGVSTTPFITMRVKNDKIFFYIQDDSSNVVTAEGTTSITANTFYMATLTWDVSDDEAEVFLNAVSEGSDTNAGMGAITLTKTTLGALGRTTDANFFKGTIDEVGLFDIELSQEQITSLFNGSATNDILPYPFTTGVGPSVTLVSPSNSYISNVSAIDFNVTVTDDAQVQNVTLFINGVANETNSSGYNGTYIFSKSFLDGNYNWSIEAYDNSSEKVNSGTRTFVVDTFNPTGSIESPNGIVEYHIIGTNLTLNVTVTDPNLDSCWYQYNYTNNTFSCVSGIKSTVPFSSIEGQQNLTVYANDTAGNTLGATTSWIYQFRETNRTVDPVALQTGQETLQLVGVKDSSVTNANAILHYNGYQYASVKTGTGNDVIFTNVLDVPSITGAVNVFWEVTYTNASGTFTFNTTNSTQTVFAINLTECFVPSISGLTLNFTTYETTNNTPLNSQFEATFQFYAEGGTGDSIVEYLFSDLNENRSNYMFCLSAGGQNVTLDAFISYTATDYDRREYIIDDGIIGNFTQEIPLYLTETALTDIVTITVQDQGFDPIAGALVAVQEWNVGTNTYSTVGMLTTSSEGQGIIDLELYTTWYRAVVSVDGEIVRTTDVEKRSSTNWVITVQAEEENPYDLFGSIGHGLTFDNSTNITTFTWLDSSGYTSRGCMIVQNLTNLGPVTIFNSCVTSVSGTIDYQIVGNGNYHAYGIIFLEGYDQSQIVEELPIRLGKSDLIEKVSPFGKVISFIAIVTAGLIGVAASSVILGGVLLIVVLVALMKLGFMNIGAGFVWGIISIVIIGWFIGRKKR